MHRPNISPATEDYLRTIYSLEEDIKPVIAARVADEMGVSASTMVSTLRRLEREGYVRVERRKEIHLTVNGRKVAEGILRRHYLIERFLTDLLDLDWVNAHQEAHRLEHAVSQDTNVEECTVYGAEVEGAGGKAGMAAIHLKDGADFDGKALAKTVYENLPPYAMPQNVRSAHASNL